MVMCVASCEIGLLLMECSRRSESGSDMAPPRPYLGTTLLLPTLLGLFFFSTAL